jgi:uncharacterized protein YggE
MDMQSTGGHLPSNRKLLVDLRLVTAVLFVVVVLALCVWRPWNNTGTDARTVTVNGEATITAAPDEFVFYPNYQFKNASRDVALADMTKKSEEIVAGLKKVGISEDKIKTNSGGNAYPLYPEGTADATYSLNLTVTAASQEQAQKVSDYLVTTAPLGSVSPQASFSKNKRKELEAKARDAAAKDARSKADQMGKNLGFKVGKVKTISDDNGFGIFYPAARDQAGSATSLEPSQPKLSVHPGQNDLDYTVKVTYFIR